MHLKRIIKAPEQNFFLLGPRGSKGMGSEGMEGMGSDHGERLEIKDNGMGSDHCERLEIKDKCQK